MRFIPFAIFSLALSACVSNKAIPDSADSALQNAEPNTSLRAFEEVCIRTAPSFSGAKAAAEKYGITDIEDMGFAHIGMSKDESIGVQIKPDNECVITTAVQKASNLTREFLQVVGRNSKTAASTKVPTKAQINGTTFIFHHDRNGGEAFVMLKANG
ncbi:MAG: hypothetical protein V4623_07400 [Pseudomonadota bacterium]